MKKFTILFLLLSFSLAASAQKPKPTGKPIDAAANSAKTADGEAAQFDKIVARARAADEKLRGGDAAGGARLFKQIVADAPAPLSDRLLTEVILQIPNALFFGGQRVAAVEIAHSIEKKIENNANQLLGLATFYLSIEDGDEAKRLADKAVALDASQPAAYQTLGIANRLNFNLEAAANSYSKALELAPDSIVSKRSLAEMRRATGDFERALALYREILAKDAADKSAQTGLVLTLFDAGQRAVAEVEMTKALAQNPNNLVLLVGASYWHAARGESAKAIELAQKALAVEPRYIWAYVALARGLTRENRFTDAERALLAARNYGSFPTLDYELAAVRLAGGFYREAAEGLAKSFSVKGDIVSAKLGGRVERSAAGFTELLAPERSASIFEPIAADTPGGAQKLKELLDFYQKLETSGAADADITEAADKFIDGADKMKLYRQLFVADRLLAKTRTLPKVGELMRAATGGVDAALDQPGATSAVLADGLYDSRLLAASRNEIVIVPNVPRQTLSNILRGRIEEITGWALYQDDKPGEAVLRLRRAASVLPEKSTWWRSGVWRLGAALQADGKPKEALDAYLKSYPTDAPDVAKRIIIEGLYREINGNLDGLDARIGAKTEATAAAVPLRTKTAPPVAIAAPATAPPAAPTVSPAVEVNPAPVVAAPIAAPTDAPQPTRPAETVAPQTQKPLFEPIIITVPKTDARPKARDTSGGSDSAQTTPCRIVVSRENIALDAGGGNLSISVGFENAALDVSEIRAVSGSAANVEIIAQPRIDVAANRVVFAVKSISDVKGTFTIAFEAACGRKELVVSVR